MIVRMYHEKHERLDHIPILGSTHCIGRCAAQQTQLSMMLVSSVMRADCTRSL